MKIYSRKALIIGLFALGLFVLQLLSMHDELWFIYVAPLTAGISLITAAFTDRDAKDDEREQMVTLKTYTFSFRIVLILLLIFFILTWWSIIKLDDQIVFFLLIWMSILTLQLSNLYFQKTM